MVYRSRYSLRKLEAVFAVLISIMSVTFGYMYFSVSVDQAAMAEGSVLPIIPGKSDVDEKGGIPIATGILGAVIMPHNL